MLWYVVCIVTNEETPVLCQTGFLKRGATIQANTLSSRPRVRHTGPHIAAEFIVKMKTPCIEESKGMKWLKA